VPDHQSAHDLSLKVTAQRQQIGVRRRAGREGRRVQRTGRFSELLVWVAPALVHPILMGSLVVLATVADRAVFETLGLDDQSTLLIALGVNVVVAVLADLGVGSKLHELGQTPRAMRSGPRWYSQVAFAVASLFVAVGAALAIAWARARQFASDTDALFGSSAPGFAGGLVLFTAIGLALFVAAAVVGWRRREQPSRQRQMTDRTRRARLAALARLENRVWQRVDRGNAAVVRDAARLAYEGFELSALPAVEFPAETAEFLRVERTRLLAREIPDAGAA
jgi:hypothetical protein